MNLGSIYLVVKNFQESIEFYEKLLEMPVSEKNMDRFAMFNFDEQCIAIMNLKMRIFNCHWKEV